MDAEQELRDVIDAAIRRTFNEAIDEYERTDPYVSPIMHPRDDR